MSVSVIAATANGSGNCLGRSAQQYVVLSIAYSPRPGRGVNGERASAHGSVDPEAAFVPFQSSFERSTPTSTGGTTGQPRVTGAMQSTTQILPLLTGVGEGACSGGCTVVEHGSKPCITL